MIAISSALVVLGYGELAEAEVPDENIWHHPERMEEWWDAVKQRREHGLEPIDEAEPADGSFIQNELTRQYKKGGR